MRKRSRGADAAAPRSPGEGRDARHGNWRLSLNFGDRDCAQKQLFGPFATCHSRWVRSSEGVPHCDLAIDDGSINHTYGGSTSSFKDATAGRCFAAPFFSLQFSADGSLAADEGAGGNCFSSAGPIQLSTSDGAAFGGIAITCPHALEDVPMARHMRMPHIFVPPKVISRSTSSDHGLLRKRTPPPRNAPAPRRGSPWYTGDTTALWPSGVDSFFVPGRVRAQELSRHTKMGPSPSQDPKRLSAL